MDGLVPLIFHGERSELREKYGLVQNHLFLLGKLLRQTPYETTIPNPRAYSRTGSINKERSGNVQVLQGVY